MMSNNVDRAFGNATNEPTDDNITGTNTTLDTGNDARLPGDVAFKDSQWTWNMGEFENRDLHKALKPPDPSNINYLQTSAYIRRVAHDVLRDWSVTKAQLSPLLALCLPTTAPAPLRLQFKTPSMRYPRKCELALLAHHRLTTIVHHEILGDIAEELMLGDIVKWSTDGNETMTDAAVVNALRGEFPFKAGGTLSRDSQQKVTGAQKAMLHTLESSREADFEHHHRRTHGDILEVFFHHIAPGLPYYVRNGTGGNRKKNIYRGNGGNVKSPLPDLEDVIKHKLNSSESVVHATEIKTRLSIDKSFMATLFNSDGNDMEPNYQEIADQQCNCPGFAYRFLWPTTTKARLTAQVQIVVQVWTAMVSKALPAMEVSCSDTTFFFFRPPEQPQTLYISRLYSDPDCRSDTVCNPDTASMTNLTRAAMRYVANNPLLCSKLESQLPDPVKTHWPPTISRSKKAGENVGVDWKTCWELGKDKLNPRRGTRERRTVGVNV